MLIAAEGREDTTEEVIGGVANVVNTLLLILVGDSVVHTGDNLEVFIIGGNTSPF